MVIEEGDPYLVEAIRAAGIAVEGKPEMYRYGELNVNRVKRIMAGDTSRRAGAAARQAAAALHRLPVSHGVRGAQEARLHRGRRHRLLHAGRAARRLRRWTPACAWAPAWAWAWACGMCCRKSRPAASSASSATRTFMHTGVNGLIEMIYNPPTTGHVLIILDNGTTAMTGQQEHPATGTLARPRPGQQVHHRGLLRSRRREERGRDRPGHEAGGVREAAQAIAWPATICR